MKIKRFTGGSLESNGYIICTREQGLCYIIDPGYEPKKFIDYISQNNLKLGGILLTHHHHDHTGGVEKIKDYFDCPVMIHYLDSPMLKNNPDRLLSHGDIIPLEDEEIKVLHTPGHTAGSVCFAIEKSKTVFSGDTIFDTDLGRTDLSDGSPSDMINTCKTVIDKWPNDYMVYPGHDGNANMKQIRKYNTEFLSCLEA